MPVEQDNAPVKGDMRLTVKIVNFALEGKIAPSKFKSKCRKYPIKQSIPKIEVTATGTRQKPVAEHATAGKSAKAGPILE
jgi:hypothetical protein